MEGIMLRTLQYVLTVPTSFRFGERYIKVAMANETQKFLANYLMELTLQEYSFLKHLPSMIASSAVYLALKMTGHSWSPLLENQTGYKERDLQECVTELYALAGRQNPKYCAVRKKYASTRFGEVSKIAFPLPQ